MAATRREQQRRVRRELDAQVARIQDVGLRLRPTVVEASAASSPARSVARAEVALLESRRRQIASGLREARATHDRRRVGIA